MWFSVAQATPAVPDLGGATGWGAFGLTVLILGWLAFWHLPAKDKQLAELTTSKDEAMSALLREYNTRLDSKDLQITTIVNTTVSNGYKERDDFRAALDKVINHCAEENHKARDSWVKSIDMKLRQAVRDEVRRVRYGEDNGGPQTQAEAAS